MKQKNEPKKSKEKRSRYARKVNRTRTKAEKGQDWKHIPSYSSFKNDWQ